MISPHSIGPGLRAAQLRTADCSKRQHRRNTSAYNHLISAYQRGRKHSLRSTRTNLRVDPSLDLFGFVINGPHPDPSQYSYFGGQNWTAEKTATMVLISDQRRISESVVEAAYIQAGNDSTVVGFSSEAMTEPQRECFLSLRGG